MNKIIINLVLILACWAFCTNLSAETDLTCPSIHSVHQLTNIWPHGPWLPLYASNDELASLTDITIFSKTATLFIGAEWSGNFLEMAHCHYAGNDKIILARDMLKPDDSKYPQWVYDVGRKLARCFSINENICPYGGIG